MPISFRAWQHFLMHTYAAGGFKGKSPPNGSGGRSFVKVVFNWYFQRMQAALRRVFRQLQRQSASGALAYEQVRQAITQVIEQSELAAGAALPSEREIATALDVSRVTVRRALAGLIEEGVLSQRHGAGTFVNERIVRSFSRLTGFTDDLRSRGLDATSEFLERGAGQVTPEEAMALQLSPGARVVRLVRVRRAADRALAFERTAVPQDLLADPADVTNSLYDVLEARGLSPVRALQRLRAVAFDAQQAAALDLPIGTPGLFIERRAFLADGRAVEFTRSWYRGDAYDFVAELHRD